jgi:hypothetical protein
MRRFCGRRRFCRQTRKLGVERIVDASAAFGAGALFLTIQAHSYWVDKLAGPDLLNAPNGPDYFYKREGGQLILLTLPGI